jgi:hypothetical protein
LGVQEPGLQLDDVLPQEVILRLESLEAVVDFVVVPHLLLQLLDIALLTLPEGPLNHK